MADRDRMSALFREWARMFEQLQAPLHRYQEQVVAAWEPVRRQWEHWFAGGGPSESEPEQTDEQARQLRQQLERLQVPIKGQMEQFQANLQLAFRRMADYQRQMQQSFARLQEQIANFQAQLQATDVEPVGEDVAAPEEAVEALEAAADEVAEAAPATAAEAAEVTEEATAEGAEEEAAASEEATEEAAAATEEATEEAAAGTQEATEEAAEAAQEATERAAEAAEETAAAGEEAAENGDVTETTEDLEDMTRQELYERAQKRQIRGRSDMTKDELIEALRQER